MNGREGNERTNVFSKCFNLCTIDERTACKELSIFASLLPSEVVICFYDKKLSPQRTNTPFSAHSTTFHSKANYFSNPRVLNPSHLQLPNVLKIF